MELTNKEFTGIIIPKTAKDYYDAKLQGRYRVHIAELEPHLTEDHGLLVKNHVYKYQMTTSDRGEYGSYYPLHAGTKVIVKFYKEDYKSGYIDRIIGDYEENTNVLAQDCNEPIIRPEDRDEQYIILKTPRKWNIFYINENTENEPNTMYVVYNRDTNSINEAESAETDKDGNPIGRRTVFRIDESGIQMWTRDNERNRIIGDRNSQIDSNETVAIGGYRTEHIYGDEDLHIEGYRREHIEGYNDLTVTGLNRTKVTDEVHFHAEDIINLESGSDISITAGGNIEVDVGSNNINLLTTGDMNLKAANINIEATTKLSLKGDTTSHLGGGVTHISSDAGINIVAGGSGNVDVKGTVVNLMSGTAIAPGTAISASVDTVSDPPNTVKPITLVRDLGPNETTEYDMDDNVVDGREEIVGDKCDNVTTSYNVPLEE